MQHAKLSPSSSSRWLTCTSSVEAIKPYENKSNSASEWGTVTHGLGELILKNEELPELIEGMTWDEENHACALEYANYVRELITPESVVLIEERFDLSSIAPDTFGTGDATVLNGTHLHIIDLKTGHNIVMAENNTQLMLYAVGAIDELEDIYDIDEVTLHIVQTRANHIDTWTTSYDEIIKFKEFAKEQAGRILSGDTEFSPNDKACKWCPHKVNCDALNEFTHKIMLGEFDDLDDVVLSDNSHIKRILDNAELITGLIKAAQDIALEKLEHGENIDGYKLVEGRSNRAWSHEDFDKIESYLVRKLKKDGAYTSKLISPTQALKSLDDKSKKFIEKFIVKPKGKTVLAPMSDKRKAVNGTHCEFDDIS